jgi:hypothetical protein
MLSKNFISLLESMKSPYNEMYEDKDERRKKKEERRRERREEKFGVSTSDTDGTTTEVEGDTDFKIRPFIRAVDQLKSQVQSEIFNIDQTIKNRESGHQSASTYKTKFNAILEIILKINSKLELIKDKEGRNLEAGTAKDPADSAEIKIFRGLYTTASNDFLAAQKEWAEKKQEADTKYLSDLKDTETNNFIIGANTAFDEAKAMLNDLIRNSQSVVGSSGSSGSSGTSGLTGDIIKPSSKPYARDSKEGKIVIQVKNTIYAKFKKYDVLNKSAAWKDVYKNPTNVSGSFGTNTEKVIRAVKAGLKNAPELKSDKTADITPAFIAAINKMSESKENTHGRLITFSNFIKNKINEDDFFDEEAAGVAMSGSSSSDNSGSNDGKSKTEKSKTEKPKVVKQEYKATGFTDAAKGNEFRAWVIKKHADWAKTNSLDATGPKDNRYIRKAYSEFGAEYAKTKNAPAEVKTEAKLTNKQLAEIVTSIKASGAKAEIKITTDDASPYVWWYRGKEQGSIFNNFRLTFNSSSGKKFVGAYATGGNIKFDNGKTITLKDFVTGNASFKISGEKPEVAQSKKAFVASSGDGYTNVRSSAMANTGTINNLIYKHTNKSSQIGVVVSSQVVKSPAIGDKTWYKVQFPTKMSGREFGYVRSDTVDLK